MPVHFLHLLVIGHRGASGYLPEHTLQSYALAMKLGADFVEPDLVATKDGRLVARHEPNITDTTDVASHPEFADRKRAAVIDGVAQEGWFASDFTLAELQTLRAVQPRAERPQRFNGRFAIPTLDEIIGLVKDFSERTGRTVGIYPETKHPTYHRELGLALEDGLVGALEHAGWNDRDAPVFIQSFEAGNLRQLRTSTPVPLIQLIGADGGQLTTDAGLDDVAGYADGIGPAKPSVPGADLVARAHARGMLVHPYTFRNDLDEYLRFFELGVDGVFSDFADTAVVARELFWLT